VGLHFNQSRAHGMKSSRLVNCLASLTTLFRVRLLAHPSADPTPFLTTNRRNRASSQPPGAFAPAS
jgi:hypothetical protein